VRRTSSLKSRLNRLGSLVNVPVNSVTSRASAALTAMALGALAPLSRPILTRWRTFGPCCKPVRASARRHATYMLGPARCIASLASYADREPTEHGTGARHLATVPGHLGLARARAVTSVVQRRAKPCTSCLLALLHPPHVALTRHHACELARRRGDRKGVESQWNREPVAGR
jgi:hypothetical protein